MDPSAIDRLMWDAYRSTDGIYCEAEALAWADGFQSPGSEKIRDDEGLQRTGSLGGYVSLVHQKMSEGGRLSHASIIAAGVPEDDPDYSGLQDLASRWDYHSDRRRFCTQSGSTAVESQVCEDAVSGR